MKGYANITNKISAVYIKKYIDEIYQYGAIRKGNIQ